jgi:hypothetical protein
MLIGAALILGVVSVALAGGRLMALGELTFARAWTLPAALGIQMLIVYVIPGAPHGLLSVAHVASYAFAAAFVWANWRVPGIAIIAAGGLLNFAAIAANRGVMPASSSALATAGLDDTPGQFASSISVQHPHLGFLGDVFAVPASWPVANVFSVGDVLIVVGATIGLHAICGSRPARALAARRTAARAQA